MPIPEYLGKPGPLNENGCKIDMGLI